MKKIVIYFSCFLLALMLTVAVVKIAGVDSEKSPPTVIYAVDIVRDTNIPNKTVTVEIDPDDWEYDENSYRRIVYIPEHIIVIEVAETEEEYMAPETETEPETIKRTFEAFTSYVYGGERKKLPASEHLQEIVYIISTEYGLPYRTVLALLGVETTWNEDPKHVEVHGGVRYIGIGCISEKYHAKNLASKGIDIYTLEGNVEGICYLLKAQYDRFGSMNYAIMAYNGGAGYAQSQISRGITENSYVRRVNSYAESFR